MPLTMTSAADTSGLATCYSYVFSCRSEGLSCAVEDLRFSFRAWQMVVSQHASPKMAVGA